MQKNLLIFPVLLGLLSLTGCGWPLGAGIAAGGIYGTKPGDPPPADTADQIAPHESWCYGTLGKEVECFTEPQDTPPGRLINVDPANRYPLNKKAYAETLTQSRLAAATKEMPKPADSESVSANPPAVQPAAMTPIPPKAETKKVTLPKKATVHKAKKHKSKKSKIIKKQVTPAIPNPAPQPAIPN